MDAILPIAVLLAALLGGLAVWALVRRGAGRDETDRLERAVGKVADAQIALAERLAVITESMATVQAHVSDRLQVQERTIVESLQKQTEKTATTMTELEKRLVVIDAAQKNITELSGQVVGLQDILSNKQARGAFGEVQLHDLVTAALPPSAYEFQATLSNNRRADCLLQLPNPPGPIVIDSKFPLESYHALANAADDAARAAAGRAFAAAVLAHVKDIAERYILPGETAESALMFLPSEAVYAELHARFSDTVARSYQARVWIVSPTTLMATLNTVRAVLKDVHMREQAGVIQIQVRAMLEDVKRLEARAGNLQKHFDQAAEDVRQIRISTEKVTAGAEKIENVELGEAGAGEAIDMPANVSRIKPASGP
jgi:DNA recombination protein RmuC